MRYTKIKNFIKNLAFRESPFPVTPFGNSPRADKATYLRLHEEAKQVEYLEMDEFEAAKGWVIDRQWLDHLALHTQVVIKKSSLNWQHGRLLYSTLREYLDGLGASSNEPITILETGTARGFSAVCMARALLDAKRQGVVITLDVLPHNTPMYWNCIDDHDGKKTRQELLSHWPEELAHIVFIQGWTRQQLHRTGLLRVHFAFLDAQHTKEDVLAEYAYVSERQKPGDMMVFDDVTPGLFDGVVQAVEEIEKQGVYRTERFNVSGQRGYAVAVREH